MPVIHLYKFTFTHKGLAGLPFTYQIPALEKITVFESVRRQPLRREHQHAFTIESEKVRAFPHITQLFFSHREHAPVLPLAQIGRPVHTHLARIPLARANDHVPPRPFTPYLRIAEVMQPGRCVNDGPVPHKLDAVTAGCQALNLVEISLIAGIAVEFVAGVNQRQRIAIHHR
ncbi:Uncharacterised protein [Klebsiella pneumoniae]|nr:Uncharacterised protein [Klebsiella pneumoniae]